MHQFLDRFHDGRFSGGIERGSWLIQKKNGRVFQEGSRNADPLALTDAEMTPALTDQTFVTVRKL